MRRRTFIARSQRWFRLARTIAARRLLAARIAKHRQLAQALGLTGTIAEPLFAGTVIPGQGFDGVRQIAPFPVDLAFRSPFEEQVEGEEDAPFLSEEPETIPDQQAASISHLEERAYQEAVSAAQPLIGADQESIEATRMPKLEGIEPLEPHGQKRLQELYITEHVEPDSPEPAMALTRYEGAAQRNDSEEPVAAQTEAQQKRSESLAPAVEIVTAKRQRGRVQEQPAGADQAKSALRPVGKARRNDQEKKVSQGPDAHMEGTGQEELSADALFAPRGTDRSPQAWMARLLGAKSAVHDDMASPVVEPAKEQEDVLIQGGDSEQPVSKLKASTGGQFARDEGFPSVGERPRAVKPRTEGIRKLEAGNRQQISEGAKVVRDDMQARAAPVPLSLRTKRFLQPLVGIDLEKVRVYRDATAEHLTDAYQADAVTIGERVEVAAGHLDDTPETLGLLAHEFTHVARQREPRFIPPIARTRPDQSFVMSEEALAQQVEGRVKRAAQERVDRMESLSSEPMERAAALPTGAIRSIPAPRSRDDHENWGGLPAPWEPLPDWLAASSVMRGSGGQAAAVAVQPVQVGHETGGVESRAGETYGGANTLASSLSDTLTVQRAGRERGDSEEEAQPNAPSPQLPPPAAQTPEPNLDDLARQVYTLLKRRLGVEYRREG